MAGSRVCSPGLRGIVEARVLYLLRIITVMVAKISKTGPEGSLAR
jgi:hypothetical protein